jgi:peptide/nickel transport system substrate-binding protein
VFADAAVVAHSHKSPALEFWYNPHVRRYYYNPEKAKALLDEAGWKVGPDGIREREGVRLSFVQQVFSGDIVRMPQAELFQYQLRAVGIEMLITTAPAAVVTAGMRAGTMDAQLHNWTFGSTEPCVWVVLHSEGGDNRSHWGHPRVDELIEMGRREMDPEKRRAIYWEIQEIVAEEVVILPMTYWDWFNSFSGRVKGLPDPKEVRGSAELFRLMHRVWLED